MNEKTTTNEIFGIRLRDLRKQNGYTIEQFAATIGVAKSTLGYYENEFTPIFSSTGPGVKVRT